MALSVEDAEPSMVKRVDGRVRIEIEIDSSSEHNVWCDLTMDLEQGGIFVATHQPLRLGTVVELSLHLPEAEEPVAISGVVRWTRAYAEASDGPAGVGIKFCELPSDVRDSLRLFVETVRDPILFELDEAPMRRRSRSRPSARPLA